MQHSPGFLAIVNEALTRVTEVDVDFLRQRLDSVDEFYLIDVREDNEWAIGHLPGAIHLGKGIIERDIEKRIPETGSDIILYCGGGYRSALAAEALQKMGYHNVKSLAGGVRAWQATGNELIR